MSDDKKRPQALFLDEETADLLKQIAERSEVSPSEIIRATARMLKYAMGRKIIIEGEKRFVEVKTFEKFKKTIDIDNNLD